MRADAPMSCKSAFRSGASITPRTRALKTLALSKSDVVNIEMDAFDDEFNGYSLTCIVPFERKNGNNELWVDAQGSTWNFLSKLVAHEHRKSLEEADEAIAVVDSPNTAAAPIAAEPAAQIAHSPKRQSPGDVPDVECASPCKRQTTLLSFMKPSP